MALSIDVGANSGVKASVSSFTYSHTAGTLSNGAIFVIIITRGGASTNADMAVTAVTYNGVSLTKSISVNSGDSPSSNSLGVEIWYLAAPASGTNTVSVTFAGTVNNAVAYSLTMAGVDQSTPIEATNSSHALAQASPDTTSVTTISDNAYIIDGIFNKIGTSLTKGASQTLISTELFPNGGGDTADASYRGAVTPAGSTAMSWTFVGSDDYAQALAVIKPFVAAVASVGGTMPMMGV